MRFLAIQKLAEIVRRNVHAQARDVRREQTEFNGHFDGSSVALASFLLGNVATPNAAVAKAALKQFDDTAINALEPNDREILLLGHQRGQESLIRSRPIKTAIRSRSTMTWREE